MSRDPGLPRRVLVFAPYVVVDGRLESPHYDLPEYRAEIAGWMDVLGLDWSWVPVTRDGLADAVAAAAAERDVLVFNLCDGTVSDGFPGIEVVTALAAAAVPFTGADEAFYRVTTSKAASKRRLIAANVPTAPFVLARTDADLAAAAGRLPWPLFLKPDVSAGSYGIQIDSVVRDLPAARRRMAALQAGLHGQSFASDGILIEPFIEGREFTVLVAHDPGEPQELFVLAPGERVFDPRVPAAERFLAFERYWGLPEDERPIPPGDPYYWYALAPPDLRGALEDLARRAFHAVGGQGYARVDIRRDERSGDLLVLEVNAQCGLSSDDSSTVGSILKLCGTPMTAIIERILRHGWARRTARLAGAPDAVYVRHLTPLD